ncbi:MAG: flagellar biosynthesis protein FlhF [bacterium]|nr:flagellar biosynthesis protein FlhF [bacterium]
MELKKYRARLISEAMDQIRSELGPDAVILSTAKISPFDSIQNNDSPYELFEITVGIEPNQMRPVKKYQPVAYGKNGKRFFSAGNGKNIQNNGEFPQDITQIERKNEFNSLNGIQSHIEQLFGNLDRKLQQKFSGKIETVDSLVPQIESIQHELLELKHILSRQSSVIEQTVLPRFAQVCNFLIEQDVDPEIVAAIYKNGDKELLARDPERSSALQAYLEQLIIRMMKFSNGLEFITGQPKLMSLIGPTGVGKTTTIAKIAADVSLIAKKKVALFTIDTFRIGAQEQLKSYAEIVHIPFEVIRTSEELRIKLNMHRDKDLILIDTTGRSGYDSEHLNSMKQLLESSPMPIDMHLVLSAGARNRDLFDVVKSFSIFPITNLIFSKLDETKTFGSILNIAVRTQIPVSYITTGQNVPEDIEIVSAGIVAQVLTKGAACIKKFTAVTA